MAGERTRLIVVDLDPGQVRSSHPDFFSQSRLFPLLTDVSPWAVLLLLRLFDVDPQTSFSLMNPELGPPKEDENALNLLKLRRMFIAAKNITVSAFPPRPGPSLGLAAILSPDEPELDSFFSQLPDYLSELVIVWDSRPGRPPDLPASLIVRQCVRSLDGNFAAQRNQMLSMCESDWVLYLDGDERLSPQTWNALPGIVYSGAAQGFLFPRRTLYPDENHCKVGYGLWPDLQLRLFRRTAETRFVRPVHERLCGIGSPLAVVCRHPIIHLSRLLKKPDRIAEKLRLFDQAGQGGVSHRLSPEYPRLPLDFFPAPNSRETQLLVLPSFPD